MKNTGNAKLANIRRAAAFLRKAMAEELGVNCNIELSVSGEDFVSVKVFQCADNFHATNILRALEIGERTKSVFGEAHPWHTLSGNIGNIHATVFAGGLPPSCKLVEVIERVPKVNIVSTPVEGEFIEVKRLKTVCG